MAMNSSPGYRARINRDAGHPGQGVKARGSRDTQSFSHLTNGPPHCVSPGLGFTLKLGLSKVLDFDSAICCYQGETLLGAANNARTTGCDGRV